MPKVKLTVQGVKALPIPDEGRVNYFDEVEPGLVLRVASSGTKSYSVMWRKGGKRPRVTLGITDDSPKRGPNANTPRLSLAEAREEAKRLLGNVRLGKDPAEAKRERAEAITFAKLAREYVARWAYRRKSPKGAREDELRIDRVLIPRWGHFKAADIRKRDVVELLDEYADAGKVYARNRMQSLVSKVYNFGIRRDAVQTNPAQGIDREPEEPRKRVLTDYELKVLLPLFEEEGLAGLGFRFLLLTGQRPSEVFGMRWSEVDRDTWLLPKARTKNKRSKYAPDFHTVPLSQQAFEVLRELKAHRDDSGFVFPSATRKDMPFTNYSKAYRRVKKEAKLGENWRVYDFKSTMLTGLERLGAPGPVVSAVAGHLPTNVTRQHYAFHDFANEKRDALSRWGAHVEKLDPATVGEVVELRR